MTDLTWQADAACAGHPEHMFLVSYTHTRKYPGGTYCRNDCPLCRALGHCGRCPVLAACRAYALTVEAGSCSLRDGVWGGLTPNQRAERTRTQVAS